MSIEERLTFIEGALAELSRETRAILKPANYTSLTNIESRLESMRNTFKYRAENERKIKIREALAIVNSELMTKERDGCAESPRGEF